MITRKLASALALSVATLVVLPGCAVQRGQSTMGEYFDDTKITSEVKAKFVQNKEVDASAISVETLDGVVQLSGFAKNATEKPTGG
ncbi:MAG TPA: BON domain-containing protein [Burkholderiaceae bacterium]|nr:BON domain-containing protein [Burkholderiaceae bacterium]